MRATPTERQALAAAATLTPLTLEEAHAIANLPDLMTFPRRHDRLRLAQTRLVWAAEEWHRRELRLALYRHAVRAGDRTEIHRQRVDSLDTPTKRIRQTLTYNYARLLDAQAALFRLF